MDVWLEVDEFSVYAWKLLCSLPVDVFFFTCLYIIRAASAHGRVGWVRACDFTRGLALGCTYSL